MIKCVTEESLDYINLKHKCELHPNILQSRKITKLYTWINTWINTDTVTVTEDNYLNLPR